MASELFALKEVFNALNSLGMQHNFQVSSFGVCEKQPACLEFLQKNHKPKNMIGDMLDREVSDHDGVTSAQSL